MIALRPRRAPSLGRCALPALILLATLCLSSGAMALGKDDQIGITLLRLGQGFDTRPGAVEQLLWEANKRTSLLVREQPLTLELGHADLFRSPLLVLLGQGPFEPLSEAQVARLSRYLRAGGALFVDDASPLGDDGFDVSLRRELARVLPGRPLVRLSNDHTLYRSFFLLERAYGRIDRSPFTEGIDLDDRTAVIYSRNDLFGAFGRDPLGGWRLPVVPGGETQREMAFRLGINLVMYATCLSYKRDQVHVTEILRRRKWRVDGSGSAR